VRFGMDFLRVEDQTGSDPRYLGLTAGHYGALAIGGIGIAFLVRALRNPKDRVMPVALNGSADNGNLGPREGKGPGKGKGAGKGAGKGKGKGKRRTKAS